MDVCQKMDVFKRHVLDRQLNVARILSQHFLENRDGDPLAQSAFAIVTLGFSYFEMIEQFATGESSDGRTGVFFKNGFTRVFPDSVVAADDAKRIYKMLRNGMYHTAMPTDRCGLSRHLKTPIANENGVIVINPALLIDTLIQHFQTYCCQLRDGSHCYLQQNFERMFDSLSHNARTVTEPTTTVTAAPWDQ